MWWCSTPAGTPLRAQFADGVLTVFRSLYAEAWGPLLVVPFTVGDLAGTVEHAADSAESIAKAGVDLANSAASEGWDRGSTLAAMAGIRQCDE